MNLFGVGPIEIIVVLIVILALFGPDKLPELAKKIGGASREIREGLNSINEQMNSALETSMNLEKAQMLKPTATTETPANAIDAPAATETSANADNATAATETSANANSATAATETPANADSVTAATETSANADSATAMPQVNASAPAAPASAVETTDSDTQSAPS